jgi:hypothetical protein
LTSPREPRGVLFPFEKGPINVYMRVAIWRIEKIKICRRVSSIITTYTVMRVFAIARSW